ncbi:hypothetical protein [Peptacetobacter hiranonis]|uniref:hypothetical protein n=1 Tax=Peptacetobacter hiranonis TaxID=89152 RepID=UPI0022E541C5|nr:hypothetical protein [Peptacetobacter hiranonis]
MINEKELLQTIDGAFQSYKEKEQKELEEQQKYKIVSSPRIDRTKLMTCKEVSKICPISEGKLRMLCKNSKNNGFPCVYFGDKVYILVEEVYNWLLAHIGERF